MSFPCIGLSFEDSLRRKMSRNFKTAVMICLILFVWIGACQDGEEGRGGGNNNNEPFVVVSEMKVKTKIDNDSLDEGVNSNRVPTSPIEEATSKTETGTETETETEAIAQATRGTNNDSNMADAVEKRTLPDMSQKGGVIFFVHIPKTGGTTVRRNMEELDRVQYIYAKNFSTYWDTVPLVEDAIIHGTVDQTILFYEIHATSAPSFYRLRERLRRWRDTAKHNQVPFFFFTLLRQPLSYAFSHFSFFHVQYRNPTFEQCNATEENFLRLSLDNPQCQFLFKGEPSMRAQIKAGVVVKPEECDRVHDSMMTLLDWVGTTESLSDETLPLLSRILGLSPTFIFNRHKVTKDSGEFFGIENVTQGTIEIIQNKSGKDIVSYERARNKFILSMWK